MTALELLQSGQPLKALPLLKKKADKEPTVANLLALASAQRTCCKFDACKETLRRILGMTHGQSAEAWNNIAQVETDLGNFQEVPHVFRKALECAQKAGVEDHSVQQVLLGMAYSLMRLGQFEEIWPAWEGARMGVSWSVLPQTKPWRGEKDSRVLIAPEGGFGDAFLFSRWIPQVRAISDRVGLVMWDKLVDFCDWKRFGVHEVIPLKASIRAADWDYTISIMSLPAIFKMKSFVDVPPDLMREAFYLTVPTHERLGLATKGKGLNVGYAWRAEETGTIRKIRSLDYLTAATVAKGIGKLGAVVHSLCPAGKALNKHDDFKPLKYAVQNEAALATWRDTALKILKMDLVVSVDTAVFHLAGLLGVPTLLLLPVRSDWKYGVRTMLVAGPGDYPLEEGPINDHDPWYGNNVRYYRETNASGWTADAILDAVKAQIEHGALSPTDVIDK